MMRLVLRRALQGGLVVIVAVTATFLLLHLAPGDPIAATIDNPNVSEAVRHRLIVMYGLDQPLGVQYVRYVAAVAHGDLGVSFSKRRPVAAVLADALPNTLVLVGIALALSFVLGVAAGVAQAVWRGRAGDRLLSGVSLLFYSIPEFWLALGLLFVFAYRVPVFPVTGMTTEVLYDYLSLPGRIADRLHHLVLPVLTLTLASAAAVARHQRAALLGVLHEDYVRTARAKGLAERRVLLRHALRTALLPVITLLGLAVPALVGGVVFVEKIFAWPGMGLIAVEAVGTRDYALVTGIVIVGAAAVAVGALLADVLAALADPRLRDARD